MQQFTIVGLDPEDPLFLHHEDESWEQAEALMRILGVSPVLVLKGFVEAADGRTAKTVRQWAETYERPVNIPFSLTGSSLLFHQD